MSGPVDVLAVMDAAEVRCGPELAAAMVEARAAVAELIEAAGTLDRIERGLWHERGRQEAVTKLCAALARVQP